MVLIPARTSLYTLVVRETAYSLAHGERASLVGLTRWSRAAALLGAGVLAIPVAVLLLVTQDGAFRPLLVASAIVWLPAMLLLVVTGAVFAGHRQVALGQIPEQVLRPLFLLALLAGWSLLQTAPLSASEAMAVTACGACGALVASAIIYRWQIARPDVAVAPKYLHHHWMAAVGPLFLFGMAHAINTHVGVFLIGVFVNVEEVGLYRVAVQCVTLVIVGQQVVNMAISPRMAELYSTDQMEELQLLVKRAVRTSFLVASFVAGILMFFGDRIIELLFGASFASSYSALSILCVGHLASVAIGPVGALLNMAGQERAAFRGVAVAAVINVGLNVLLIPQLGMHGAALAAVATLFIWNAILRNSVNSLLGIEASVWIRPTLGNKK